MNFDPYTVAEPVNSNETISLANAFAYEWGYRDATQEAHKPVMTVPAGWPYAWLEHVRRNPSRMSIQSAFKEWVATRTLPGL